MQVTNTSSPVPSTDPFAPTKNRTLDQDEFMQLFITQLQNQDPMKPMDSYEMASQMAMFSNVEALYNMNSSMEELLAYQTSQNNLQLLTLLDQDIQANGNLVAVSEGVVGTTDFTLKGPAAECRVEIYDLNGNLIQTLELGPVSEGDHELNWDGKDLSGQQVEDGAYQYAVKAKDYEGQTVAVETRITGLVTGLDYSQGKAMLILDGSIPVDVGQVIKVN